MQRLFLFRLLSLLPVVLSTACYWLATVFHEQYAQTHGAVSRAIAAHAPLDSLASPEVYFARAEAMFAVSLFILAVSVVLAIRCRHWLCWIAALIVAIVTFAMPMHVLWRA